VPEIGCPALVVGHPGHELKVFGWMSAYKPRVYVITNGSGRHGISRISSTAGLLTSLGVCQDEIFGYYSDAQIYNAILQQNFSIVFHLLDDLAASFLRHNIDCVVGDAAEGFNPAHDLCRSLINAAVLLVERTSGRKITNLQVSLTEWEHDCPQPRHDDSCLHWSLDDSLLAEKIAAARQYFELKAEVQRAIAQRGEEYFRLECLRRTEDMDLLHFIANKPAYETWGEQRAVEGRYQNVIRFQQHLLPMMKAIFNYANQATLEAFAGWQ